jgi:hypothetical protein
MTTRKDLPEEATEEPRIVSPEEDAERAQRRLEASGELFHADEALELADPKNPLRIPGELSSKPREERGPDRERARHKRG